MNNLRLILASFALISTFSSLQFVLAGAPIEGRPGRDEIRYMTQMIDHHSMASMMASDCLTRAETEAVMTLCQSIIDKQTAEIQELQNWLSAWYGVSYMPTAMMGTTPSEMEATPEPEATAEAGMMSGNMMNMPMSGMMVVLSGLEGQAYEVVFMETVIDHHEQAINMSERLLEQTADEGHQELRDFAQRVIDDQSAESEQMESMIAERS